MTLDLRRMRYVVTLAEAGHFGLAAQRLHLTQSALSQQIAKAEREIGAPLFTRGRGVTRPTPAGEEYVARARALLERAEGMTAAVRDVAANGAPTLRVGLHAKGAAELTPLILRGFARAHPRVRVATVALDMRERSSALLDGDVDVVIAPRPLGHPEVTAVALYTEPRIAGLPAQHQFARRRTVDAAELLGERFVRKAGAAGWSSYWTLDAQRGGPARDGGEASTIEEAQAHVAYEGAVTTGPESVGRLYRQPGVAHVRLTGVEPVTIAAERRQDASAAAVAFSEIAALVAAGNLGTVPGAAAPRAAA